MSRRDVEWEGIRRRKRGRKGATEAVAAAAVTSRLVFLITPDPGRAEEEELLSDVSIMTRLCTEVHIPRRSKNVNDARKRRREASSYTPRGTSRPGSRVETVR